MDRRPWAPPRRRAGPGAARRSARERRSPEDRRCRRPPAPPRRGAARQCRGGIPDRQPAENLTVVFADHASSPPRRPQGAITARHSQQSAREFSCPPILPVACARSIVASGVCRRPMRRPGALHFCGLCDARMTRQHLGRRGSLSPPPHFEASRRQQPRPARDLSPRGLIDAHVIAMSCPRKRASRTRRRGVGHRSCNQVRRLLDSGSRSLARPE
jgi:hypothetical protein